MAAYDTNKVLSFIKERWGGRGCPVCGKGPWSVQDKVFQLTEFHSGSMVIGGPVVPVIPVTCSNCGNTTLINAIICGAVPAESTPPPANASAPSHGGKS